MDFGYFVICVDIILKYLRFLNFFICLVSVNVFGLVFVIFIVL